MLTADAGAVPDGLQPRVPAHVVDMPVGPLCRPSMVGNACPQPSGAERAANVEVPARLRLELARAATRMARVLEERRTRTYVPGAAGI